MKKLLTISCALILTLTSLCGCAVNNGGSNSGSSGNVDYDVNIDMSDEDYNQTAKLTVGVTGDVYESELIAAVAKGFKLSFPNVTIETVKITGSDYVTAVGGRVNAKSMTDVFFTSESESSNLIAGKYLLDLQPYVNAEVEKDPNFLSQFVGGAMKMGQINYAGDQYFIPRSSDRIVTHLNMKYIKELPSDIQALVKNGWTWDEFLQVCAALRTYYDGKGWTADKGRYLVDASFNWSPVMFSFFKSNGASFYEDGNWTVNSAEMKTTISMIRNIVEKRYIAPKNGGGANYENGNGAMLFHSSSAITKYKRYIGDDYNIVTFPTINGDSGVYGYGVPGYGIYSGVSKEKRDLAWQFLKYVVSADGQNALAKAGMNTPSIRADLQDFTTAEWGKGLEGINLAATTFETERNYSETFFWNFPASTKNGLIDAVSNFVNNIIDYTMSGSTATPNISTDTCIANALKDLKKKSQVK